MSNDILKIGGKKLTNRLIVGTGKFPRKSLIPQVLDSSGSQAVTVALRRVDLNSDDENVLDYINQDCILMPNTSGARNAEEAVKIAQIAQAAGCGNWVKIEVIKDQKYLLPDNSETLKASKTLVDEGFKVFPYVSPELSIAQEMEQIGVEAVMPLGAPIGTNKGLETRELIKILISEINLPIIVDAGIGRPSQAAEAMELGCEAVLVNTAIATAENPVLMAEAFSQAVKSGRKAYLSKAAPVKETAEASSPLTGFLRDENGEG
ncbi:thiazole synthase [Natranaerobius thermophilus]|uniref:Thiazole synthase n=1 Tax=Natranaerobius thermophilus (strain ATCC BAA-1301 / DSM 18059 / JW/NM-WN-LF) TaxID=457570 RepID=B2A6F4_NATTJ|nr:thiazole synthase [Natranaerobius thermophilus]ACB85487.1 thiazole biosynthesis family protein [Natranaerobius thermophilus JW/NM-WN-LF]